jgi:lactoylglutathione lyase
MDSTPEPEVTMTVAHIDHLNLTVHDLDVTIAWYASTFGFEVVEDGVQDGTRWCVIRSGEAMLCLYEFGSREHLDRFQLRDAGRHGLNHFALRITDRDAWLRTVQEQGLELRYDGEVAWPHSSAWYLLDPTGYEIEVALWKDNTVRFGG